MIKIGEICPLFFNPIKNDFQQDIDYIQKFYTTDRILIQVLSDDSEDVVSLSINDLISGSRASVNLTSYRINSSMTLYYARIGDLSDSVYSLSVREGNSGIAYESEPFAVCSDPSVLSETCLIEYSNEDNNSPFNCVFWIGNVQQVFEFRIEGGFKPGGIGFKVENEQFRNQFQNIVELYSVPYVTYSLTCGNAAGIPYWMVELVNNILSLAYVFVNGERYVRSGNSVPENTQVSEDGQTFNATILLEKNGNAYLLLSPNPVILTGTSCIVNVKSNVNWEFEITEGSDFISYEGKNSGRGNKNITLSLVENTTGSQRVGKLVFSTGELNNIELDIVQESVTPFVTIDEGSLSVVRQGGEYTIHVSANADWRNDYHPDWVALSRESGGAGEFDVKVTVSPNTSSEFREDDIGFVTLIEGGEGANCVVTQTAEGDYLVLSSDNVTIGADGSGVSVGVQSNLQVSGLTLTSSEAWLMATEGSDTSITVSASANTGESRTGSITVSTPSGITEVITVNQEAETAVTPYVRPTSNHVFFETAGEGDQLLELDTNVGIADISVMFIDDDWCACNLLESNGRIYVKIDVTENTDGYPRIGLISLELADGATETHAVAVGQMGTDSDVIACSPLIYIGPEFTVVQDDLVQRSYTQTRFYVVSDNDWNVTSQDSFTLMDPTDGGLEAVPTMTEARLDISANSGSEIRAGEIIMEERYGAAATIYLLQGSDGLWIDLSGDDTRNITNESQNVTIVCPTNLLASQFSKVSYEILDGGGDWMTLNSRRMSGSQFILVFAVQANGTGNAREARILIKHADILPIVVTIIQQA